MKGKVIQIKIQVFEKAGESEIAPAEDYSHLRFSRGFLLSREKPTAQPEHWRSVVVGGYFLCWDSRSDAAIASTEGSVVVVIGNAFHLGLKESNLGTIAVDLLNSRESGADSFDMRAQLLSGRYVLLDISPEGAFLQSDAAGMRSVYYATDGGVAASHSLLAAKLQGDQTPSIFGVPGWFRETGARAIPGRRSEYEAISMLTPNTKVDISAGAIARIKSAMPQLEVSSEEIAASIIPLVHAQLEALTDEERVLVSLTAGLDSRTTLAMTRPFKDKISYFSYVTRRPGKPSPSEPDMLFAQELCREEGLDFQSVIVDSMLGKGPLMDVMRGNSTRIHVPSIAAAYMEQLPTDSIHVRSNLYEIGRALIRSTTPGRTPAPLSAKEVARRIAGRMDHATFEESIAASAEWLELTGFAEEVRYDELDLYYWELLMGKWLPAVMIESDVAHDTYTVINSRHIIDLMLSAPLSERISGGVANAIISQAWPELMSYPVNGHKTSRN